MTAFADTLKAMTPEQGQQMCEHMQAIQAQNWALLAEIEAGRQREAAAVKATADERRPREVAVATARAGLRGINTKLLGKPSDFHGEDDRWLEWSGAAVPHTNDLLVLVEKDDGGSVSNVTLNPDLAVASRQLSWMLLMLCNSSALQLIMTAPRSEGAESWRKLVQRYEPTSLFSCSTWVFLGIRLYRGSG